MSNKIVIYIFCLPKLIKNCLSCCRIFLLSRQLIDLDRSTTRSRYLLDVVMGLPKRSSSMRDYIPVSESSIASNSAISLFLRLMFRTATSTMNADISTTWLLSHMTKARDCAAGTRASSVNRIEPC